MKNLFHILILAITIGLVGSGCSAVQNANNTQKGAAAGAAGGAVIGGIIGNNVGDGNTALGAIIGGVIGGAAGGLIGKNMDKQADMIEDAVPGAEVNRVGEGIQIVFDEKSGVNFAYNSSELTPTAKANLDAITEVLVEFPDTDLIIEGHTDDKGSEEYNMKLSQERAQSVADYFASHDVARDRLTVKAFGETSPRFSNETEEDRAKNRRVEIGIIANEDMIQDAQQEVGN